MRTEIVNQPTLRVAAVRHIGPYDLIASAFMRLDEFVADAELGEIESVLVGIYHHDPNTVDEDELRSDAGITLPAGVPIPAGLTEVILPAGRYLCGRHVGPYSGLQKAWAAMVERITSGELRRGAGPGYELYPNTPMTAKPEELITDIHIPVVTPSGPDPDSGRGAHR
ncbi:MAG: GyrI-like domain-containing protein [Gemmatimonadales bacterium]